MTNANVSSAPRRGLRRLVLCTALVALGVPTLSILTATAASAAPTEVQDATTSGSGIPGSTVQLTATLPAACTAGDTLIAMVTILQNESQGGTVTSVPAGWQRLYEHSPFDDSPYQGWFALSNCQAVQNVSFSISSPGNTTDTEGSMVVTEFSGLPDPLAVDFANNDGSSSATTSDSLSGSTPSASGELTLAALSFYGASPMQTTPSGFNVVNSTSPSLMPAFAYWKLGTGTAPTADFSWSPSSAFEVTILALKAGPAEGTPNVVQEAQNTFSGATSAQATLPNGVTAGDSLVALIGTNASGSGPGFEATSVNNGGVTWQQVVSERESAGSTAEVWVGYDSSGSSIPVTVSANLSSSLSGSIIVAEVSHLSSVDTTSVGSGGSSSTSDSVTPFFSDAEDFLVALNTTSSTQLTHPAPEWSTFSLSAPDDGGEWQSDVPAETQSPTWTTVSTGSYAAVAVAFHTIVPTVTGVVPSIGNPAGGNSVTISGTNLAEASSVAFGARSASFTVTNADSITATAPSASNGLVNVTVTTPQGTSAITSADQYTYTNLPTITGVSPGSGPATGGTSVTITGVNFSGASAVSFGGKAASSFTVNSATQVTATSPAGSAGTVDVTVTAGGITSAATAADHFTYTSSGPTAGYWMVGSDGGVFAFGNAPFEGSLPGDNVHVKNIVGVVPTSDNKGYWMVGSDGGVFAFGDAGFKGSLPGLGVHVSDIVGVVPTSDGGGYWMVGADGGVFAFGDAGFKGSLPGLGVHVKNIVGVVPTHDDQGYWMVGSDGGVFAFGDATFKGSLPGLGVHVSNIRAVVPTHDGNGYWMIGTDGGVFAFGDAGFLGSLPGLGVHVANIVGAVATADGGGYWMVGSDGGVFAFGDATFVGSLPGLGVHVNDIVGVVPA